MSPFTDRQIEVVRLIASGHSADEVGSALSIAPRTAKAHGDEIRRKLRVQKRREIPAAYMRVTGDDPYPRVAA